jgi:hypothetical protein
MSLWFSSSPCLAAGWTIDRVRGLFRLDIRGSLTAPIEALEESALPPVRQCADEKPVGLMMTKQKLSGQCWTMPVCVGCFSGRGRTVFRMRPLLSQGCRAVDRAVERMCSLSARADLLQW